MDDELRELERRAEAGDPLARERLELLRRRAGADEVRVEVPPLSDGSEKGLVGRWLVAPGDWVRKDQPLVELELDKVSIELPAPAEGVLSSVDAEPGAFVRPGELLGHLEVLPPRDPELEARHDALLARVAAAPEEDGPREEYGRFLEEAAARGPGVRGWGRGATALLGEVVRLALRCRRGPEPGDALRLSQLEARTWRTVADLTRLAYASAGSPWITGGLLCGLQGHAGWIAKEWPRLLELGPLGALGIRNLDEKGVPELLALPGLERVGSLALGPHVAPAALTALAASPRLRPRRLALRVVDPVAALAAFGARELRLEECALPTWLAGSSVERLELDLSFLDRVALHRYLAAIPDSTAVVVARVRVGAALVPEEELRAALGARLIPAGPPPRPW